MKKIIKIITSIFFILCVIFFVINISDLSVLGYRAYIVLSGSMKNKINVYDVVVSKKVSQENIKIGDIISFENGGGIITHRVINIEDGLYTTKGDNNNTVDAFKTNFSNIKGKVVCIVPKVGKFILFFKSKKGLVILFSMVFLFYFINAWVFKRE